MTAAPGPQQPDEVRPRWPHDREWVPDDEVTCMYCQRYKNRKVCRCGNPNPPRRPAAPSAQPDDPIPPCTCGHREPSHRGWGKGSCEAPRCPCGEFTPAQPVRDTGEGRR